jgi:F-box protein 21
VSFSFIPPFSLRRCSSNHHVSVCDKSVRYVAAENIGAVDPNMQPSDALMKLAGRHFKRWDESMGLFVSNVRDEYPQD